MEYPAKYKVIMSDEVRATLEADFSLEEQQLIAATLIRQLSFLPSRFPIRYLKRSHRYYRVLRVEQYGWAYEVDRSTVNIVFAEPIWLL